jgi:hypothetical protein
MSRQRPPRPNVGAGRHLDDEIEGILAPGTPLPKSFGEFGELLGSGEIDGEQPVPVEPRVGPGSDWASSPRPRRGSAGAVPEGGGMRRSRIH